MSVEVSVAATASQLDEVRALMRAFVAWHRERHQEDLHLIDRYFDPAVVEQELASLPGEYRAPDGELLLASWDGAPAGCVALRRLDHDAGEVKRMYVDARFRGNGVGVAMTERLLADARSLGYRRLRLETSVRQAESLALYRRFGFAPIAPYYEVAVELREWLVFMELEL